MSILREMYEDKSLPDFMAFHDLVQEVDKFGNGLGATNIMVWVNFPLAYTQVLVRIVLSDSPLTQASIRELQHRYRG